MSKNNDAILESQNELVETQYVDENGNPIDPSLIDENGNYIETVTEYVDENGNPVNPNEVSGIETKLDENNIADSLNNASETGEIESVAAHQMDDKKLFTGMVTFDYNNVPITDIVNSIILDAINKGASDLHFDPFDDGIKIRIRIDGLLNDYSIVPLFVKKNMITRIKIISGMNITESRTPQDGAIRTELADKTVDLRVSCLPTNLGEKIVIRVMDYSMTSSGVEALDFSKENLEKVLKMLALPNGIILVTGATGTGKSTTVYSMLQKLNVEGSNLITVEDPIEMNIGGINQVQAQPDIGLDFATVLRSILRQDPDVIMIGEIRDDETARIAVRASITGHLVLSTIHTNNSLNTIERLTDMSVERYLLGSALEGIVSQKLARRLCDKCKRLRDTTEYEKEIFKKALNLDVKKIYEPVGCPECSRGYRGRIAIHEVLLLNQQLKDAIVTGVDKTLLRKMVYGDLQTKTMLEDGLEKVIEGHTSFDEILKMIDLEDDLGSGSQLGLSDQLDAAQMNNLTSAPVAAPQIIYVPYPVNADGANINLNMAPTNGVTPTLPNFANAAVHTIDVVNTEVKENIEDKDEEEKKDKPKKENKKVEKIKQEESEVNEEVIKQEENKNEETIKEVTDDLDYDELFDLDDVIVDEVKSNKDEIDEVTPTPQENEDQEEETTNDIVETENKEKQEDTVKKVTDDLDDDELFDFDNDIVVDENSLDNADVHEEISENQENEDQEEISEGQENENQKENIETEDVHEEISENQENEDQEENIETEDVQEEFTPAQETNKEVNEDHEDEDIDEGLDSIELDNVDTSLDDLLTEDDIINADIDEVINSINELADDDTKEEIDIDDEIGDEDIDELDSITLDDNDSSLDDLLDINDSIDISLDEININDNDNEIEDEDIDELDSITLDDNDSSLDDLVNEDDEIKVDLDEVKNSITNRKVNDEIIDNAIKMMDAEFNKAEDEVDLSILDEE